MIPSWTCYVRHADGTRTPLTVDALEGDKGGWLKLSEPYTTRPGDVIFWEMRVADTPPLDLMGQVAPPLGMTVSTIYPGARQVSGGRFV
jgi:hypothetical protein